MKFETFVWDEETRRYVSIYRGCNPVAATLARIEHCPASDVRRVKREIGILVRMCGMDAEDLIDRLGTRVTRGKGDGAEQ